MSINYRKTDSSAVAAQVMKDRAVELEQKAFAAEMEVDCLVRLLEIEPVALDLIEKLEQQRNNAMKLRRAAVRAAGASPLSADEIKSVRSDFFDNWLGQLEVAHAMRVALFNEASRQIELKGVDALNEDELEEMVEGRNQLQIAIDRLESRHEFCLAAMAQEGVDAEDGESVDPISNNGTAPAGVTT